MTAERLSDYDGMAHILLNPTSSQHRRLVRDEIGDLVLSLGDRVNLVFTDQDPYITQEKIASCIKPGDIIVSGSGDGGDSLIVRTLLQFPGLVEEVRKTPVLSLYGGNANQGPAELTPKKLFRLPSIKGILQHGMVIDAYAGNVKFSPSPNLEADGEDQFDTIESLFNYFAGVGATGHSADELHRVRMHRLRSSPLGRNLVDIPAVLRGISRARNNRFEVQETIYETPDNIISQSDYRSAHEVSFVNGERMAKFGMFSSRLEYPEMYKGIRIDSRWLAILRDAAAMMVGRLAGDHIPGYLTVRLDYKHKPGASPMGHIDGDSIPLPREGSMEVRTYPEPYRVVTTNTSKY